MPRNGCFSFALYANVAYGNLGVRRKGEVRGVVVLEDDSLFRG